MRVRVCLTDKAEKIRTFDEFDVPPEAGDPGAIVDLCATDIIESWSLSVGDTITIREVAP